MKRLGQAVLVVAVAAVGWYQFAGRPLPGAEEAPEGGLELAEQPAGEPAQSRATGADAARRAFEERASGRMLRVDGRVARTLADDRDGSRHQRFIIETNGGQTLLVAHNIDLAPRLDGLKAGDSVALYGEYEWNDQGGIMHWTHHDPAGRHEAGYIEWRGRKYQ
jgi:hypothetical protein